MKIKYLGIRSTQKSTGCPVCRRRSRPNNTLKYTQYMTIPSTGRRIHFILGEIKEVTEDEGEYLKSWTYVSRGQVMHPFIEV